MNVEVTSVTKISSYSFSCFSLIRHFKEIAWSSGSTEYSEGGLLYTGFICLFILVMLELKPKALNMLGKYTRELGTEIDYNA